MKYYVYIMYDKVEMASFDDLDKAHRYCQNPPHFSFMYIIWEGDINRSFEGYHGVPLAMYVNGKRYDVSEHYKNVSINDDLLIDEVQVNISIGRYIIKKYKSTTIKVLELATGRYVTAHPLLRQINSEMKLGINLDTPSGDYQKNTRQLGHEVIKALHNKGY